MDDALARRLCALNSDFYRMQAKSFSSTRHTAWPGWDRCVEEVLAAGGLAAPEAVVLDVACGNLRFEQFAAAALPAHRPMFHAVDDCDELALAQGVLSQSGDAAPDVRFHHLDVVGALLDGTLDLRKCCGFQTGCDMRRTPAARAEATGPDAGADLAVAFGFLHHIPGADRRVRFMDALLDAVVSGGFAAVSLWCFMRDGALAQRACRTHAQACLELGLDASAFEHGDYLLGWNNVSGAWRYCHHFEDGEADGLAAAVAGKARVVARFAADGRTGNLNEYLVLQRL